MVCAEITDIDRNAITFIIRMKETPRLYFCGVIFFCLTGRDPEDALSRLLYDELERPSDLGADILPRAEQILIENGFLEERVRMHGNIARIEVPPSDIPRLAADGIREEVYEAFRELGFLFVTLDLKGYRLGSMNATLKKTDKGSE